MMVPRQRAELNTWNLSFGQRERESVKLKDRRLTQRFHWRMLTAGNLAWMSLTRAMMICPGQFVVSGLMSAQRTAQRSITVRNEGM